MIRILLLVIVMIVSIPFVYGEIKETVIVSHVTVVQGGHILVPNSVYDYDMKLMWDTEGDLTITSITAKSPTSMTFYFPDKPVIFEDVKDGVNEGILSYKIKTEKRCETEQQVGNCLLDKDYEIPIEIRGSVKGVDLIISSKLVYFTTNKYIFQYVILVIVAIACILIIYKLKHKKSSNGFSRLDEL